MSVYVFTCFAAIEMVGPRWRNISIGISQIFWAFGYVVVAGCAYVLREWTALQLALTVPEIIMLVLYIV